jgi:hypothetical protein
MAPMHEALYAFETARHFFNEQPPRSARVKGTNIRVQGLGLGAWGLGFRV